MSETEKPAIPALLRGKKALKAAWKPILLQLLVPGWGYWSIGQKGRAKAFFAVWAVFLLLGALQLQYGAVDGVKGGIYVFTPGSWLQSLSALGTAGIGPAYGAFAWAFGGAGTEPVRNLTQEYGASYIMVAGLLNWLCCFDLFDRATGRWHWRLPKDERVELGMEEAEKTE
ncbi:MAG TPA: DUF6677 family protein [Holophagaceae bacterium]|nr:DUF6677 family protein [Holophagaceae bacterium]